MIRKKQIIYLFIYLLIYFLLNSNELYKQLLDNDKDKFEAELGTINLLIFLLFYKISFFFLALKQLLVSLCKSCLQGSQSVETIIRIFGELQVN
jgi:hypothetical protein